MAYAIRHILFMNLLYCGGALTSFSTEHGLGIIVPHMAKGLRYIMLNLFIPLVYEYIICCIRCYVDNKYGVKTFL